MTANITAAIRADEAAAALVELIDALDDVLEPGLGRTGARRGLERLSDAALAARDAMRHSSTPWDDIVAAARAQLRRERTPLTTPARRLR